MPETWIASAPCWTSIRPSRWLVTTKACPPCSAPGTASIARSPRPSRPGSRALDAFEAATFGDVGRLAVLLEADPGLTDRRSGDGFTALHLAAFFGQEDAVRLLLARGADPDAYGTGWMTGKPLNSAASAGRAATVDLLLEAGADPDAVQRGGWTPLHSAAHNGDARTVELLLAHGADSMAIDDEGRSVADMAAERV